MNYRHIFHAGNHADVLKHAALLATLARMQRKETPLAVIETHAGIGLYDLDGPAAARSPEWRFGIGALMGSEAPSLRPLLQAVAAVNPGGGLRFYPGSPELARLTLRPQDRYAGCELHPEDAAALKARYAGDKRLQIHARDGWEALKALLPPAERRGLVLIDPPYETPGEAGLAAQAVRGALRRFGHGVYLWWRPLKDPGGIARADAELFGEGPLPAVEAQLTLSGLSQGLTGSSVLIVNPPFGLAEDLAALTDAIAEALPTALQPQARVLARGAC
jgi:23S rRNA (adenine2030-N6)-methyltransferase